MKQTLTRAEHKCVLHTSLKVELEFTFSQPAAACSCLTLSQLC